MNHVEMLAQFDDVACVFDRSRSLAAIDIGNMRCAADADEVDVIATQGNVEFGGASCKDEFGWCGLERGVDQISVDINQHRILIHGSAGLTVELSCFFVQHPYAEFLDHP